MGKCSRKFLGRDLDDLAFFDGKNLDIFNIVSFGNATKRQKSNVFFGQSTIRSLQNRFLGIHNRKRYNVTGYRTQIEIGKQSKNIFSFSHI